MIFDGRDAARHLECLPEANRAVLLDPMHRTNWCAFRMVRQDRLCVRRDGVACDECRIGEVAVNTLLNIAMAVEATLLFWRDRDLETSGRCSRLRFGRERPLSGGLRRIDGDHRVCFSQRADFGVVQQPSRLHLTMAFRQVVEGDRGIKVVLDVVIDVVREHPPMQPPRCEIRSRSGKRRAVILYNPVLADGSVAQQRLLDCHHRDKPEQEVFQYVTCRECDDRRANVKRDDGPTVRVARPGGDRARCRPAVGWLLGRRR